MYDIHFIHAPVYSQNISLRLHEKQVTVIAFRERELGVWHRRDIFSLYIFFYYSIFLQCERRLFQLEERLNNLHF